MTSSWSLELLERQSAVLQQFAIWQLLKSAARKEIVGGFDAQQQDLM
jgi:hypothetical protein